jgi:hypothetical protein
LPDAAGGSKLGDLPEGTPTAARITMEVAGALRVDDFDDTRRR